MSYPIGFNTSGSKVVSTPRKVVVNVPVMYRKILKVFRDEIIFDFVVEGKALKIVEVCQFQKFMFFKKRASMCKVLAIGDDTDCPFLN